MQPTFNPWIGYFDLINSVDTFVFLDSVQLEKRSWQTRNKIKLNNSEFIISIPIMRTASRNETSLNKAFLNDNGWHVKALKTIHHAYLKSKYFTEVFPFVENLLNENKYKSLSEYNTNIIKEISLKIGINSKFIFSSNLKNQEGSKDDLLLSICKELDASEYISPQGSSSYLQKNNSGEKYKKSLIKLYYSHYTHPFYNQIGKEFLSYMGIFDLIFNEGFDNALEIIVSGHKNNIYYKDYDDVYR